MEPRLGEAVAHRLEGGDVILMRVRDENVAELELVLGNQAEDGLSLPTGVEQGRLARNLIPYQVAVDGHAAVGGADAAQFAPPAQVLGRRGPALGDRCQLGGLQVQQFPQALEIR